MPTPGRNDPCPCGSGRKYKHCHGRVTDAAILPTAEDRAQAFDVLGSLANLPRFFEDMDEAYESIWGARPEESADELLVETAAGGLFLEWTWFDFILRTGQTLAEFALEKHERDFSPAGRRFVRTCLDAPMRLVQVTRVEPGSRVEVKDLLDRGPAIAVAEHTGSRELVRHDMLICRVAVYDREKQFEGTTLKIPIGDKHSAVTAVRRSRKRVAREVPAVMASFYSRMTTGSALVNAAIDLFKRPRPRMQTTEGDELVLANARFDIVDDTMLRSALAAAADIEPDDEDDVAETRYAWFESGGGNRDTGRRVLGHIVLRHSTLTVETMSLARARRAQQCFADLAPHALRFIAIDIIGFDEMRRRADEQEPAPAVDPAIAGPIERQMMESHYRSWLDEAVPALGDRTPRQAVAEKYWRRKVTALVEAIENQAERSARDGSAFDVGFLREELGLRRRR